VPVLLYKLYGARTILNTIIQSLTPHNSMLNMSLVRHSVTDCGMVDRGRVKVKTSYFKTWHYHDP